MGRDRSLIRERAKKAGLTMRKVQARRMWSGEEVLLLQALYANTGMGRLIELFPGRSDRQIFAKANSLGLKKSVKFMREQHGAHIARVSSGRFKTGHQTWNKGVAGSTGNHPNTRRTQFKKGEMHGQAQHNWVPIGTEKVREGYLVRKITDNGPYPAARWQPVHRLVWEQANGPVPEGHVVVFRPGRHSTDVASITTDAVELVSREELMARNSYWNNLPPEVAQIVRLRGQITRKINSKRKQREEQGL